MMQMLHAGGIPAVTDQIRTADDDNPRGYFEFERVKQIKTDKTWLPDACGRVVKLVHMLLPDLPPEYSYRVVFMRRDISEILASQKKMLERQGKRGAALSDEQLARIFDDQVNKVLKWLAGQPNFSVLQVTYHELIADPAAHVRKLNEFLGGQLDQPAMLAAVDPSLYRNRKS